MPEHPHNMQRVAITGAGGFVGSHVAEAVLSDAAVDSLIMIDQSPTDTWRGNPTTTHGRRVQHAVLDIADDRAREQLDSALSGVDTVIHLAANSDMRQGRGAQLLGARITCNLLDAADRAGATTVALASSSAVYGMLTADPANPARESDGPLLPISNYGAMKLAAEGMVSEWSRTAPERTALLFRFATIAGGRMPHGVIASFVSQARQHGSINGLGDGLQRRSFVHATDCGSAVANLTRTAQPGCEVLNLAARDTVSVREVATIVCEETGISSERVVFEGGTQGWNGDVPCVALATEAATQRGWSAALNSAEVVRATVRELLDGPLLVRDDEPNRAARATH